MQVMSYLHKGKPAIQVTWEAPNTGLCKELYTDYFTLTVIIIILIDCTISKSVLLRTNLLIRLLVVPKGRAPIEGLQYVHHYQEILKFRHLKWPRDVLYSIGKGVQIR